MHDTNRAENVAIANQDCCEILDKDEPAGYGYHLHLRATVWALPRNQQEAGSRSKMYLSDPPCAICNVDLSSSPCHMAEYPAITLGQLVDRLNPTSEQYG